jgi:hypothetical protein
MRSTNNIVLLSNIRKIVLIDLKYHIADPSSCKIKRIKRNRIYLVNNRIRHRIANRCRSVKRRIIILVLCSIHRNYLLIKFNERWLISVCIFLYSEINATSTIVITFFYSRNLNCHRTKCWNSLHSINVNVRIAVLRSIRAAGPCNKITFNVRICGNVDSIYQTGVIWVYLICRIS